VCGTVARPRLVIMSAATVRTGTDHNCRRSVSPGNTGIREATATAPAAVRRVRTPNRSLARDHGLNTAIIAWKPTPAIAD